MKRLLPTLGVLFALAVGIALGAGPLDDDRGEAAPTRHAQPRRAAGFDERFVSTIAPSLYAGRLAKQAVAIVTTPGADPAVVKALSDQVVAAGGAIPTRTELTDALTAPGQKTLVDTMGSQLATQLATQVPALADPALTTYPRMGQLLGVGLSTTGEHTPPSAPASTVRESLRAAKLTNDMGAGWVAPLVLVVLGDDLDDAIVGGLVQGLAAQSHGVVVTGPTRDGDLRSLRQDKSPAATVDGVETTAGRVAAVLALVHQQTTGGGGSFGASGADGAVPLE